jgi:PKD repeat protein
VITSYEWDFGDGTPGANGVSHSHTYAAEGAYTVTLRVRDDDAASVTATALVTVTAPNQSPVASFGFTPGSGKAPLPIVFSASASADSDGVITSYIWDFGDGSAASGITTAHTYSAGSFTVILTVTDDDGALHTQAQSLSVQPPNAVPQAVATGSPLAGESPLLVTFDASGSTDLDGGIVAYNWDFGDGSAFASGAAVQHNFSIAGNYTATLTVTDSDGALGADSVDLSVTEPDPPEPMLSFAAQDLVLNSGGVTELAWTATAVDSCLASGGWSGVKSLAGNEQIGPLGATTSFTLSCSGAGGSVVELLTIGVNGSVTLQWSAPTQNIDGSQLTDLAGFRIYSLDSMGAYNVVAELNDPSLTSHALDLAIGSYQFVMTAVDSDGNESGFSNSVVKSVTATSI